MGRPPAPSAPLLPSTQVFPMPHWFVLVQPCSVTRSSVRTPRRQKSIPGSNSDGVAGLGPTRPEKRGLDMRSPSHLTDQVCGVTALGSGKKTCVFMYALDCAVALAIEPRVQI